MISIEPERTRWPHVVWGFDGPRLARAIRDLRRTGNLTTRALAARADISQSYVVALERSRHGGSGPTPTVDVLARLAQALGVEPTALVEASLRRSGQHVLCVVDDGATTALDMATLVAGDDVDWVLVGAGHGVQRIDLGGGRAADYRPDAVAATLRSELRQLPAGDDGATIGLVFADTSTVMSTLPDPHPLLEFEHRWSDVVTHAAWDAGRHAAWNVCVYELDSIRALADPVATTLDLIRSHDDVWVERGSDIATGSDGERALLGRVRAGGGKLAP